MRSGLIAGQDSACIGKTYRAISKSFEYYNDLNPFLRCHFADSFDAGRL
jgi:aspartate carbamoyltransferase regulatory subunit